MNVAVQTNPEAATIPELKTEIAYLRRLNARHGNHNLRTLLIVHLTNILVDKVNATKE